MNRVEQYRQNAAECRLLAQRPHPLDHRRMLLEMAKQWDALADEREAMVMRDYRLAGLEREKG
jgi:hypothetical protein